MLTHDQAVYFLEKVLLMPMDWGYILQDKPLAFLKTYMKRHAIIVPFQNAFMAATEDEYRRYPSEKDIIDIGLTGKGGCCIQLNYFTMLVFKAIGLDTFVVRGDHYCAPIAGTHCMVMVKLYSPEDHGTYMIEVGGGYPILQPVPMDSDRLPFRIVEAGGFPYEFREIAPNWVGKFHLGGGLMGGAFTDKTETLRTSWELKPRALWEFDYPMLATFTKPQYSALLRVPYMSRFFTDTEVARLFPQLSEAQNPTVKVAGGLVPLKKSQESGQPNLIKIEETLSSMSISSGDPLDGKSDLDNPSTFIFVYKRRIVIGNSKSRLFVQNYNNYDEMLGPLSKYFPTIPLPVLTLALDKFSSYQVEPSPYDGIL